MNLNPHTNIHTVHLPKFSFPYWKNKKFHMLLLFFIVVCRSKNMKLENVISTYPSAIHKSTFSHILPRACFILNHGHPHPVIFKRRSGLLNKLKRTNFDFVFNFFYTTNNLKVWIYFAPNFST